MQVPARSADIVICSVPGTFTKRPILAPATLKSCAETAGYSVAAFDLNIEVMNKISASKNRMLIEKFLQEQHIEESIQGEINDLIVYSGSRILNYNPKAIFLSLLTQDCQNFTLWLCYYLKIISPDTKIVLGGSGIKRAIADSSITFAEDLRRIGFIDDYINGDGEKSIVEYLKGNYIYPGINSTGWIPINDLEELPISNFDDYDFSHYQEPGIPICDSRGCVRTCEFCDVIEYWKKFKYRSAKNIFQEMLTQIERYKIKNFFFYNSLTNGNMKVFNELLDYICDYNETNADPISWSGYFIVRPSSQHPETLWKKIKKSNGTLQLGIESVIEQVRISLGKNFSNADIEYHLEMAEKFKVPLFLLIIIAYPTESKQDFEFTKKWFIDRKRYAGTAIRQVVYELAAILPNTELDRRKNQYAIIPGETPTEWVVAGTDISYQDRLDYYNEFSEIIESFGFNIDSESF